jgi:N-methylhydantoinase A/oxoprolinase/acetone carboxylase beta subunit
VIDPPSNPNPLCRSRGLPIAELTRRRTTTDICALLKTGYPRQSAAFVKIAGVRTNFTIPDVHSIALGGGSIVRQTTRTSVGPDSVGARLEEESISFGGRTMTVCVRADDSKHSS